MGQTAVKCAGTQGSELDSLLAENEPPDPKPPKEKVLSGANTVKFTEIKFQQHRAGAHCLTMVSCVH
jgi:hypothetical protein